MAKFTIGGNGQARIELESKFLNRHGLIAGATGTGKTVSLQVIAEQLSQQGIPCLISDIKGDLSGLANAGSDHPKIQERVNYIGLEQYSFKFAPVSFWDINGEFGLPLRSTISELGPLLLSSLLELNEVQTGAMYACFKEAEDQNLLLLDLADLQAMLDYILEHSKESDYGKVSPATIAAIKRRLLIFEEQGLEQFLGEPAIRLSDLINVRASSGEGVINIVDVTKLVHTAPRLYATMLIWLLSELFEQLPEVGDLEKPKFVIFLDEAHLLFNRALPSLVEKIEQVVRLIRSKGVGVFFITQSPLDIPESISGQLGLKIQHALRAFTPKEKKTLKIISETFYPNPNFDTQEVLPSLGTGEALVSALDENGSPTPVEKTLMSPPYSQIGPIDQDRRAALINDLPYASHYRQTIDRESAHEVMAKRKQEIAEQNHFEPEPEPTQEPEQEPQPEKESKKRSSGSRRQSVGEAFLKSVSRAVGSQIGRQVVRSVMRSFFKRR